MSKPKFTLGIEFPRKFYCRNQIKMAHKHFSTNNNLKPYYTGIAGRKSCFVFDSDEKRDNVAEKLQESLKYAIVTK